MTYAALAIGRAAGRAFDLRASAGAAPFSEACAQGGTFATALTDADMSGGASTGDRIRVTMTDCVENDVGVTAELDVSVVSIASLVPERRATLSASVTSYVQVDGLNATITGSLDCDCSRSAAAERFAVSGALLSLNDRDGEAVMRNYAAEYRADYTNYVQWFTMRGRVENTTYFDFETNAPLYGRIGRQPEAGAVSFHGAANAVARIEEGAGRETDVNFAGARGDLDGNGEFEQYLSDLWILFVNDAFFGPFRAIAIPSGLLHPNEAVARVFRPTPHPADPFALGDLEADPARDRLYVSVRDRNEIVSISTTTYRIVDRIPVGSKPQGIALSDDGSTLYVALSRGGGAAALTLDTRQVERLETAAVNLSGYTEDVAESANRVYTRAGHIVRSGDPIDVLLAKVDRTLGDAVEQVGGSAAARAAAFAVHGGFLYVAVPTGSPNRILKLDLSQPGTPVVLERYFPLGTDLTRLTLSPDGTKLVLRTGEVLGTPDLQQRGSILRGVGTAFTADGKWLVDNLGGNFAVTNQFLLYDADTLIIHRPFTANCTTHTQSHLTHIAAHDQWVASRYEELCAFSLANRFTAPGQDGPSQELPAEPAPVPLAVTAYPGLLNQQLAAAAIDASRGYIYLTSMGSSGPELAVGRLSNGSLVHRTSIPGTIWPGAIALNDDGSRVFVLQSGGGINQVDVFDPVTLTSLAPIPFNPALLAVPGSGIEGSAHDMVSLGDGKLLLTAVGNIGNEGTFAVALNTASGAAQRIGGGQAKFPANARARVTNDRTAAILAHSLADGAKRLVRVDLQLPDPDVVADRAADELTGARTLALSPDGQVVYQSGGVAARADTFQLRGETHEGFPLAAPDGSALYVLGLNDRSLRVIDPVHFQIKAVYSLEGCGGTTLVAALIGTGPRDVWFVQGASVCRVTVPD
jgi:DNA-binding beta-propeller fold protein YncE